MTPLELRENNMNLQEKRAEWKKNQIPVLIISQVEHGYPTVFVVVKSKTNFRLHRYFPLGLGTPNCGWEISVDKEGPLEECLSSLREKLEPFNRKVEQADWHELDKNPLAGMAVNG